VRAKQEEELDTRYWKLDTSNQQPATSIGWTLHQAIAELAPITDGWTLHQAIAELAPITDVPRLEAEVLLAHILGTSRTTLLAHPERIISPDQLSIPSPISPVASNSTGWSLRSHPTC